MTKVFNFYALASYEVADGIGLFTKLCMGQIHRKKRIDRL